MSHNKKDTTLILGTALWGWSISRVECFKLLDKFYLEGFREIDTATNYPINKKDHFFRFAEDLLGEWIKTNKVEDLKIIEKVGSIDNSGAPENNLTYSFLLMSYDYYLEKFGSNLANIMIHWDNRGSELEIGQTIEALSIIAENNLGVGLSGIKYPEIYLRLSEKYRLQYTIEFKHNIFNSSYEHYKSFHGKNRFLVYGINAGGINFLNKYNKSSSVKLRNVDTEKFQSYVQRLSSLINSSELSGPFDIGSFNNLSLVYAYNSPEVSGIIIGPSKLEQLSDSINFYYKLIKTDSTIIYSKIREICKLDS